jgi:hypothetical protein
LPYIPPFIKWVFSNKTKYFTPLDIIFTAESAEYAEKDKCKTSAIFASSAVKKSNGGARENIKCEHFNGNSL